MHNKEIVSALLLTKVKLVANESNSRFKRKRISFSTKVTLVRQVQVCLSFQVNRPKVSCAKYLTACPPVILNKILSITNPCDSLFFLFSKKFLHQLASKTLLHYYSHD